MEPFDETNIHDAPPRHTVHIRQVPLPLPGNARSQWRIMSLLEALSSCRGSAATVEQLHTLVWALQDERNATALAAAWSSTGGTPTFRGYVPDLLPALRLAQHDGLLTQNRNSRQTLTDRGKELLARFRESGGSLGPQQQTIQGLAPINTAAMWRRLGSN